MAKKKKAVKPDVSRIFGDEALDVKYFHIGAPLDMETPVCLNLERLVERSNGIFGKTGTGKTFLTRLVLSGLIRNDKAVNFIFDMHNEYGWRGMKETAAGTSFETPPLKSRQESAAADWTSFDDIVTQSA